MKLHIQGIHRQWELPQPEVAFVNEYGAGKLSSLDQSASSADIYVAAKSAGMQVGALWSEDSSNTKSILDTDLSSMTCRMGDEIDLYPLFAGHPKLESVLSFTDERSLPIQVKPADFVVNGTYLDKLMSVKHNAASKDFSALPQDQKTIDRYDEVRALWPYAKGILSGMTTCTIQAPFLDKLYAEKFQRQQTNVMFYDIRNEVSAKKSDWTFYLERNHRHYVLGKATKDNAVFEKISEAILFGQNQPFTHFIEVNFPTHGSAFEEIGFLNARISLKK